MMSITFDIDALDAKLIQQQAASSNMDVSDFAREATMKAARNAAYLAKIDRGIKQMHEGSGTIFTDEELRKLIYGDNI